MSGLDANYCFIDSNILITTFPSTGGVLSGDGIIGDLFNPALAGAGYHIITFTYGTGNCMQIVDTIVFVQDQLFSNTYINNDSLDEGIVIEDKSNPEKNLSHEFKSNEIFKASDMMVDALTQLIARTREKN